MRDPVFVWPRKNRGKPKKGLCRAGKIVGDAMPALRPVLGEDRRVTRPRKKKKRIEKPEEWPSRRRRGVCASSSLRPTAKNTVSIRIVFCILFDRLVSSAKRLVCTAQLRVPLQRIRRRPHADRNELNYAESLPTAERQIFFLLLFPAPNDTCRWQLHLRIYVYAAESRADVYIE